MSASEQTRLPQIDLISFPGERRIEDRPPIRSPVYSHVATPVFNLPPDTHTLAHSLFLAPTAIDSAHVAGFQFALC